MKKGSKFVARFDLEMEGLSMKKEATDVESCLFLNIKNFYQNLKRKTPCREVGMATGACRSTEVGVTAEWG